MVEGTSIEKINDEFDLASCLMIDSLLLPSKISRGEGFRIGINVKVNPDIKVPGNLRDIILSKDSEKKFILVDGEITNSAYHIPLIGHLEYFRKGQLLGDNGLDFYFIKNQQIDKTGRYGIKVRLRIDRNYKKNSYNGLHAFSTEVEVFE